MYFTVMECYALLHSNKPTLANLLAATGGVRQTLLYFCRQISSSGPTAVQQCKLVQSFLGTTGPSDHRETAVTRPAGIRTEAAF